MQDLVGKKLGKYQIEVALGRGGMAAVYKAMHPQFKRYVAIKTIHAHLALEEGFVERFLREAEAVARLRHPNIVRVFDFDFADDIPYMVMEYISGQTLEDRLLKKGETDSVLVLSLTETTAIFLALADAIQYAHEQGVVHRDLKPTNIMFSADGDVVLTDFGIAHFAGSQHTPTGELVGTPEYMSPEQAVSDTVDARSDIYSLGVILFRVLTGHLPFHGTRMDILIKHITEAPPRPTTFNTQLPSEVETIILTALEKKPENRYSSVREMADALERVTKAASDEFFSRPGIDSSFTLPVPPLPYVGTPVFLPTVLSKISHAPFQVPRDIQDFVGRGSIIQMLSSLLLQSPVHNLICITGMGGIGKTALAIRLAHSLRNEFPDGVLWANVATSDTLAILDSWAHALEMSFSNLPDLASRAAALRGELADKNILIVLDDAHKSEQIRHLLPNGANCKVLITTRDVELAVALAAHEIRLQELSKKESLLLLANVIGEERLAKEPDAANEIIQILGNLPLAVEIAARKLETYRRRKLGDFAERLRDEQSRLDELAISDREVRSSFAVSWVDLKASLRRTFAQLAVFEGRAFRASALAAVAGTNRLIAVEHLDALVSSSLLSEEGEQHYRQHPLLADFAREHLGDNQDVRRRMADFYLSYAHEYQRAYTVLEQEKANLTAGMRAVHQLQAWEQVIAFAGVLKDAWFARGLFSDARQGYMWACEAAEKVGDQRILANYLSHWGQACIEQGDYAEAEKHLNHARGIYEELEHPRGLGRVLYHLGRIAIERAKYGLAEKLLGESRDIREKIGDGAGVAEILFRLAFIEYYHNRLDDAEQLLIQAVAQQETFADWRSAIRSLNFLTNIELRRNNLDLALNYSQRTLALCEEYQEQSELAIVLSRLSDIYMAQGNFQSARENREKSLELLKRMGGRKNLAQGYYKLSILTEKTGEYGAALEAITTSLKISREIKDEWGLVYVLLQAGDIHRQLNQFQLAHQIWEEAMEFSVKFDERPLFEDLHARLGK